MHSVKPFREAWFVNFEMMLGFDSASSSAKRLVSYSLATNFNFVGGNS